MAKRLDWIDVQDAMPSEHYHLGTMMSDNVEVLLSNGDIAYDFTIEGAWTYSCEKQDMPHPVKWRPRVSSANTAG